LLVKFPNKNKERRRNMRLPKKGEKGFTLIELLIVVAILGVLAAVVIPNVGRFLGRGEDEARRTEFHNISSAIVAMMVDNSLTTIPNAIVYVSTGTASNDMTAFPDSTSAVTVDKVNDPDGTAYQAGDDDGFLLYGHDRTADNASGPGVNYVNMTQTTYYYTCETDGTIRQFNIADLDGAGITEYTY
jgi:type IV pilus assembly protein PilA